LEVLHLVWEKSQNPVRDVCWFTSFFAADDSDAEYPAGLEGVISLNPVPRSHAWMLRAGGI
jgi:hypothetical protein